MTAAVRPRSRLTVAMNVLKSGESANPHARSSMSLAASRLTRSGEQHAQARSPRVGYRRPQIAASMMTLTTISYCHGPIPIRGDSSRWRSSRSSRSIGNLRAGGVLEVHGVFRRLEVTTPEEPVGLEDLHDGRTHCSGGSELVVLRVEVPGDAPGMKR